MTQIIKDLIRIVVMILSYALACIIAIWIISNQLAHVFAEKFFAKYKEEPKKEEEKK